MALYEATLAMTYQGQQCVNRFNYVSSGTPAGISGAAGLAWELGGLIVPESSPSAYPTGTLLSTLRNVVVASVTFEQLTVNNVYDPTDFYQAAFVVPMAGVAAPPGLSPVSAFGFRTNVVRRDIRRGTKRFVGVPEAAVQDGGVIEAEEYPSLNALGDKMSAVLTYTGGGSNVSYVPVVCGKQRYNPSTQEASVTGTAYRYYPTLEAQVAMLAQGVSWQLYGQVRSQVSRQFGRGR